MGKIESRREDSVSPGTMAKDYHWQGSKMSITLLRIDRVSSYTL